MLCSLHRQLMLQTEFIPAKYPRTHIVMYQCFYNSEAEGIMTIIYWVSVSLRKHACLSRFYINPLTAEGIYVFGQIQVLAEFESSIFDEVWDKL